tara:strand:+ start:2002 stop:5142 length:3141 start_codon:yes stop_codon:yes gene_type:complete
MKAPRIRIRTCLTLSAFLAVVSTSSGDDDAEVDFNRDIRPILSDKCFHCHGPDAANQKSDFRIDTFEHATADLNGVKGIVPGNLRDSEVHWRIRMPNDDIDVMPPLDSNRVLTRREKELLDKWIEQGAKYDRHWSFEKPVKAPFPELSEPSNLERVENAIDHFVFARLESEKLEPRPMADLETRLRRAALTLTGLPPEPTEVDVVLAKAKENPGKAYAEFVDGLLASTDYAERQALRWLDAARFADTDGYQIDTPRSNWPWRDWVIHAFDENMPFDQFTIEQLAGDMLPNASQKQILASAFNRNHRQNAEGGALADEFLVENVIDRVETTSTVWLGLTMGCARCHDHKYDPLSQREFFQMFAYFNNIGERGIGKGINANPTMDFRSPLVEPPAELLTALDEAEAALSEARNGLAQRRDAWIAETEILLKEGEQANWQAFPDSRRAEVSGGDGELTRDGEGTWLFGGQNVDEAIYEITFAADKDTEITGIRLDALPHPTFGKPRQLAGSTNGNFVLTDVTLSAVDQRSGRSRDLPIARASATFEQNGYPVSNAIDDEDSSGWAVFGPDVRPEELSAYFVLATPARLAPGEQFEVRLAHQSRFVDHNIGRFRLWFSSEDLGEKVDRATLGSKVVAALETPAGRRSGAERKTLTDYYRTIDKPLRQAGRTVTRIERELASMGAESVPVMIMQEREGEPVPAYLLERGQYDAPVRSKELSRAVPVAIFEGSDADQPRDRLEFARWIVSKDNPLTARVIVNRVWRDHFGIGLVGTSEDFGAQGELPSHPRLLDWLAVEFMESGWDLKALHRLIVTSATFQQGSATDPTLLARDPGNRLLAHGPRYRLDGFAIRDTALHAAGLLDSRVGGRPVKPYQPAGLWSSLASNAKTEYKVSDGSDLYRKSLYTYWKRAVNPPRQLIFDSGGREACDVGVRRTNTPLQALVLMNDVTFLEAARHLGRRAIRFSESESERLEALYRFATSARPDPVKLDIMKDNLVHFRGHFEAYPDVATKFLAVGDSPRDESIGASEHAAWMAVAHLILNLDTTISVE